MPLSALDARRRRTDVSGRYPRSGPRSAGRDPRRGSDAPQRRDEHRPHDRDQRGRRIRVRERAARQLLDQGRADRLQDRGAQGRARSPRSRLLVLDFTLQVGEFSEQITVSGESAARRTPRRRRWRRRSTGVPAGAADLRAQHVLRGDLVAERDSSPATRSSSACRISRAPRRCRSAAGRVAATAICSTACRSPTWSIAPRSSPRSKRSRTCGCRSRPTTRRWGAPPAASSTRRRGPARTTGTAARCSSTSPNGRTGQSVLRQEGRTAEAAAVLLRLGRIVRRSDRQEQDVLLGQHRRLPAEEHAQQRADAADGARAPGRLLADAQSAGTAGRHLRSADDRPDPNNPGQFIRDPFPGNKIPANRLNPVALAMLAGHADTGVRQVVQRQRDAARRSAEPGDVQARSALERPLDDHRHVCPPAHEGARLGVLW